MRRRQVLRRPPYPSWCEEIPDLVDLLMRYGQPLPAPEVSVAGDLSVCLPGSPSPSGHDLPLEPDRLSSIIQPGEAPEFGHRVIVTWRQTNEPPRFDCEICGPTEVLREPWTHSQCGHYEACTECLSRLESQLMRCSACCRYLADVFPVCDDDCELVSRRLGQSLSTSGCPLCGEKLAKDGCGSKCRRKKMALFETCQERLRERLRVMVLRPFVLLDRNRGQRPCCHYSFCPEHGTLARGRTNRCPACRSS